MKRSARILRAAFAVVLFGSLMGQPVASAATTYTLQAGGGAEDALGPAIEVLEFLPSDVTIRVGDTINWNVAGFHTVTFLSGAPIPPIILPAEKSGLANPAAFAPMGGGTYDGTGIVNSGAITDPYSLTFTKAGSYDYICLVHPKNMRGHVTVKGAGEAVDDPAAIGARIGQANQDALANHGLQVLLFNTEQGNAPNATATVAAGAGDSVVSALRFIPQQVTVHKGDFVTWIARDPGEPHTVTFLGGAAEPDLMIPAPGQPPGTPPLLFSPQAFNPSGLTEYRGAGFANSGLMWPGFTSIPTGWSLRFNVTGTFDYICMLHDTVGMRGTVTVLP